MKNVLRMNRMPVGTSVSSGCAHRAQWWLPRLDHDACEHLEETERKKQLLINSSDLLRQLWFCILVAPDAKQLTLAT